MSKTEHEQTAWAEMLQALETLTRTALRERYRGEYNSWRNRKARVAPAHWAKEFDDFGDFLRHVGPKPSPKHTLDRLSNHDPTYGPGLCAWRDKKEQANNRSTTHILNVGGGPVPLTVYAEQSGQSEASLRRQARKESKWGANPLNYKPWPPGRHSVWEDAFRRRTSVHLNRWDYLFRHAEKAIREERQWLDDHEDDYDHPDEEVRRAFRERGNRHFRLERFIIARRIDHQDWVEAATPFIRAELRRKEARRNPERTDGDDDDW